MRVLGPLAALLLIAPACRSRADPPGADRAAAEQPAETAVNWGGDGGPREVPDAAAAAAVGSPHDNLPFTPSGKKIASIAWRTWIYTDTGPKRMRYGYLRAGAIVDARETGVVENAGCADGKWFRVNPRGFVCTGKGATEDLTHPVVVASAVRPVRGQGLPYLYTMSNEIAPMLYFRLPTEAEMHTVEGKGLKQHFGNWQQRSKLAGVLDLLGEPPSPPEFLVGTKKLEKPYGVERNLHFSVHAGRASNDSGFALTNVFAHEGRYFGLTTELDVIALDRTHVVRPSDFVGVTFDEKDDLPVAFVDLHFVQRYEKNDQGQFQARGSYRRRQGVKLTGRTEGGAGGFWESTDGGWVAAAGARFVHKRTNWPSFAKARRKWIDISIQRQTLVAYEGDRPVYATLVSTGRGGMGDPEKVLATVRGTFMIHTKHVSSTMDGDEDRADSFNLRDVPFVQYFHKGYALHGTYWHDDFGKIRSHGCVNLSPADAAWLFEWTDPPVGKEWHGALNLDRGTVVYIHA